MANKRQGTHKAKERSEITGSNRKIKNKKAQDQLELAPLKILFLGEEVGFLVPQVRDYSQKLNKKQKNPCEKICSFYQG